MPLKPEQIQKAYANWKENPAPKVMRVVDLCASSPLHVEELCQAEGFVGGCQFGYNAGIQEERERGKALDSAAEQVIDNAIADSLTNRLGATHAGRFVYIADFVALRDALKAYRDGGEKE